MLSRLLRSLMTRDRSRSRPTTGPDAPSGPAPEGSIDPRGLPRTATAFPYRGYFINLDRSEERRREIQDQLQRLDLSERYERFPAVEGRLLNRREFQRRPAEAACFLSHLGVLEAGRRHDTHVHVMEDDVILGGPVARCLDAIIEHGLLARYDLIYTDTLVPFKPDLVRQYLLLCEHAASGPTSGGGLNGIQLMNLRGRFYACHASYLVNKDSLEKLIGLLRPHVDAGMPLPIDIYLKNLVNEGVLNAACTVPFLTGTRLEETLTTTVQGEYEAIVSVLLHKPAAEPVLHRPGR